MQRYIISGHSIIRGCYIALFLMCLFTSKSQNSELFKLVAVLSDIQSFYSDVSVIQRQILKIIKNQKKKNFKNCLL